MWLQLKFFCILCLHPKLIQKLPHITFFFSLHHLVDEWSLESSPSNAALLLWLTCLLLSMCPICIHITLKPHQSPPQLGLKHLHSHGTPTQVLSLILSDGTSSQHCVSMCDGHVQHSIVHVVPVMMGHCKYP